MADADTQSLLTYGRDPSTGARGSVVTQLPKQAPRDWSKAPWSDVAWSAARNLLPDTLSTLGQGVMTGVPAMGKLAWQNMSQGHPFPVTDPVTGAALSAAKGIGSAVQHPVQAYNAARGLAGGVNDYIRNSYTAPGALKSTLAQHPAQPIFDVGGVAGALATLPEGGEGSFLDIPAVNAISRGARAVSLATNPVALAAKGLGAGANAGVRAIRGGNPFTPAGDFTPAARAAISQAFPNGEVTDAELANPKFRQTLGSAFQNKGINPNVAKEAVLQYTGVPTPKSTILRQQPPGSAQAAVTGAVSSGKQGLAQMAQGISGGAQPDPTALTAALERANTQAYANASGKYEAIRQMPGSFGQKMDGTDLAANMGDALGKAGLPNTADLLARSNDAYPAANKAVGLLQDSLVNGNTRLGGEINAPEIAELRRQLTGLQSGAQGSDSKATGAIIDAFHKTMQDAADQGKFLVQTPAGSMASDTSLSGALKDANATYKDYFDTFQNRQGAGAPIARAVNNLSASAQAGVTGDDAQLAAQGALAKKVMHPTEGPATYAALQKALGGPGSEGAQTLDDYVRQSALATNPDTGNLAWKPAQLRNFVNGPLGQQVFTPDEQSDVRLMGAAGDVLNAPPIGGQTPDTNALRQLLGRGLRAGVGAGVGATAASFLPIPESAHLIPGLVEGIGSAMGAGAEQIAEPFVRARQIASEMRGIPDAARMVTPVANAIGAVGTASRALPYAGIAGAAERQQQPEKTDQPKLVPLPPETDLSTLPAPDLSGAPPSVSSGDPLLTYGKPASNLPPGDVSAAQREIDLSTLPGPNDDADAHASGGRVGYAEGGSVDPSVEELVDRLMKRSEQVKKAAKQSTKPLLNVPDNTMAKALSIAQGAMG